MCIVFVSNCKMHLYQIEKCICLKLWNVFVSNLKYSCLKFLNVFVSNCEMYSLKLQNSQIYLSNIAKFNCVKMQNFFVSICLVHHWLWYSLLCIRKWPCRPKALRAIDFQKRNWGQELGSGSSHHRTKEDRARWKWPKCIQCCGNVWLFVKFEQHALINNA